METSDQKEKEKERICAKCGKKGLSFSKCGRCKDPLASYCSKTCQVEHWPTHRPSCKKEVAPVEKDIPFPKDVSSKLEALSLDEAIQSDRIQSDRNLKKRREAVTAHSPGSSQQKNATSPTNASSNSAFSQKLAEDFAGGFNFNASTGKPPSRNSSKESTPTKPEVKSPATSNSSKASTKLPTSPSNFTFSAPSEPVKVDLKTQEEFIFTGS